MFNSGHSLVNQMQRTFNGLYQLTGETQTHGNSQVTGYTVNYAYSFVQGVSEPNNNRVTKITYPNGRIVRYEYNSGLDASISRLSFLADDNGGAIGTHLEEYSYLGLNTVIKRAHPEPAVDLTYLVQGGDFSCVPACDAGDQYRGLDRFGRVIDQRWIPTALPQSATDRFQYSYDRDSNRLTRTNAVNTLFNESYGYDSFNQLTSFSRSTHSEGWGLDNVGNWKSFNDNVLGNQTRDHNVQNQIVKLNSVNVQWYDANGNTTTDERNNTYKYDAWNRLAQSTTSAGTLTYTYDALNRRVVENVTAIISSTGAPQERYVYDPYGKATVLDPVAWTLRGSGQYGTSNFGWVYLHQGGRYTRFDDLSGLYYFRSRDLSPTLGRWMQEDPIGYRASADLYNYLSDDPTDLTDPSGLAPCTSDGWCKKLPPSPWKNVPRDQWPKPLPDASDDPSSCYVNCRRWEKAAIVLCGAVAPPFWHPPFSAPPAYVCCVGGHYSVFLECMIACGDKGVDAGYDAAQHQFEQVLERCDYFELCHLVPHKPPRLPKG